MIFSQKALFWEIIIYEEIFTYYRVIICSTIIAKL
jgi:hypothetical protein